LIIPLRHISKTQMRAVPQGQALRSEKSVVLGGNQVSTQIE